MNFGICDIRKREEKTPKHYLDIFFKNNLKEEIIIIGHSKGGNDIYGLYVDDIIPNECVYLLWIYVCHSADEFCPRLSTKGFLTIGFNRKILTFKNKEPMEIGYVGKKISSFKKASSDYVETELKSKIYDCAKEEMAKGEFLLAAILNYNRLSLKAFKNN